MDTPTIRPSPNSPMFALCDLWRFIHVIMRWSIGLVVVLGGAGVLQACAQKEPTAFERPGLHNIVRFYDGFYSGSAPEGDAGYDSLQFLGVRTVLSVDGAPPNATRIEAHEMRSVHLPVGYDGFDDARKAQLVRAVRDLDKPIYLHCHHGKHRSAAAAATIAISLGWLSREQAIQCMRIAGTSPAFERLWECVRAAYPLAPEVIDAGSCELPAITPPDSLVASMVAIDEAFDELLEHEQQGWHQSPSERESNAVMDAAQLADLFRVLSVQAQDHSCGVLAVTEARAWLALAARDAGRLEWCLGEGRLDEATSMMSALRADCLQCHRSHRE